jgi:hypothetical protein
MIADVTSAITSIANCSSRTFTKFGLLIYLSADRNSMDNHRDTPKANAVRPKVNNLRHGMAATFMTCMGADVGTKCAANDTALCRKSRSIVLLDGSCHFLFSIWNCESSKEISQAVSALFCLADKTTAEVCWRLRKIGWRFMCA